MTALLAGQQLEGTVYQVVRELGAGGMGVVYEVEHVRLKKRYVAKVIHDQVRGDDGVQKRMEREARILAELNHPNIVQVHDVGITSDGTSYFVMEKLEGMDVREALKRGGLGRARALAIMIDILDALDHVHKRGIVHRDIKPENVFLARQPNGTATKVLDFGIVHIFQGDDGRSSKDRITKTGGFVGTLYYAAPEQMRGEAAGPPNDIYASALVLFELLTGRGPFDDEPGVGLARCFKPAPRLDTLVPSISAPLADAVAEALEQNPAKRPVAAAFAARLRAVLAVEPPGPADAVVHAEVDDLLQNMALQSKRSSATSFAPTAAPATPLMAGAPGVVSRVPSVATGPTLSAASPLATAPTAYSATTPPAYATAQSAGSVTPQADTSPGVYQTVDPTAPSMVPLAKGRSAFQTVSAVVAIVVLLAAAGGIGGTLLSRRATAAATKPTTPSPATTSAEPPPPAVTIPEPVATPATPATPVGSVAAPVASVGSPVASVASPVASPVANAKAAAKPTAAAPAAAPNTPRGRATKEGYVGVDGI